MPLPERVLATIRKYDLIPHGARVLAAVSGGADSVALAIVLARLAPTHAFTLAGLAHLNHGLRGADADADEAFTQTLAGRLGVPCVTRRVDVAALAAGAGESIEAAARRARYAFLDASADGLGATRIATGHTADDQAETIVMRLMRGAGLHGLSAIRPRNGRVVRPLIEARRSAIEAFLRETGERWRDDASNADRAIVRNRIRHEIMPALTEVSGDGVIDALARTAALIQDDADELDRIAIEISRAVVLPDGRLAMAPLASVGPAIRRRIVRVALEAKAAGRFLTLEHVDAVRSLMKEDGPRAVSLPGLRVTREAGTIRIEAADGAQPTRPAVCFARPLDVPGTVVVPEAGLVMSAELGTVAPGESSGFSATADAVAVQGVDGVRLTVRNRRPGDALRPLGAPGRRKLQDVFVDRKIPRDARDRVPLVIDDRGRIVWVVGQTIADEFRVTAPEGRVLLLKVSRAGDSGGQV